ncbi:hypothetical protein BaRGS_00028223, partial [Batillaria attramentaria]
GQQQQTSFNIQCSSNDFKPNQCRPPGDFELLSISVVHQLSKSACRLDQSYGITGNRRAVWVNGGPRETVNIQCSSIDYKPRTCRPNGDQILEEVRVEHKQSRSACTLNVSYGLTSDRRGVWVNHGCRALFVAYVAQ